MIWLVLSFLVVSLIVNVVLVWYVRSIVKNLLFVSDNIGDFLGVLMEYQVHLASLYELEMFYGDETLKGLIDHTTFVIEEIKSFEGIYTLTKYEGTIDDREKPSDDREASSKKEEEED